MDGLKIVRRATNLFDNKSLVIHPESTIYCSFSPEMKQLMGIEDTLVRFSVGLENAEDLKQDINRALEAVWFFLSWDFFSKKRSNNLED